jgi:diguanylate cyclase (GGDEF)-like protein
MSPLRRYMLSVSVAGLGVLAFALWLGRWELAQPDPVAWVVAMALIAGECLPMRVVHDGSEGEITTSSTFAMALILAGGAPLALGAMAAATLVSDLLRRKPADRTLFNIAQYALSVAAAAAAIGLLSGASLLSAHELTPQLLPAFGVGALTFFLVNSVLVARAVAYADGVAFWSYLRRDLALQTATVGILLGLAPIVVITGDFSPFALPLLGLPLFAVHQAGRQVVINQRQALHDALTGLPNRSLLQDRLEQAIRAAARDGRAAAVLLIDLDGFKQVNDTLGHAHGDGVLQRVAAQLSETVRDVDTVARLGGDEFAVVLPDVDPEGGVSEVLGRLHMALDVPVAAGGLQLHVSASIGVAVFPDHGQDAETLVRRADMAMYQAKRSNSGHATYASGQAEDSAKRLGLVADLRRAIDADELVVEYQPKIDLAQGVVTGVEALVRWDHPQRGRLAPDLFVPLAEEHGVIRRLTDRVLELALRQQVLWRRDGLEVPVAVNITVADLLDPTFPQHVEALFERFGTPAAALRLEITENMVIRNPERVLDALARLSERGVTFALDDFGTGYSSFAHLKRLPVAELKIDRSFVKDMLIHHEDAAIVRSTVELGRSLGLHVVAEGVETAEHQQRLTEYGAHAAQGYHLSRPLPADVLRGWLSAQGLRVRGDRTPARTTR